MGAFILLFDIHKHMVQSNQNRQYKYKYYNVNTFTKLNYIVELIDRVLKHEYCNR